MNARHRWLSPAIVILMFAIPMSMARGAEPIIGAKKSKVYHTHPTECGSAKTIEPGNRIRFANEDEAKRAGRRLCKHCSNLTEKAAAKPAETPAPVEADDPPARSGDTTDGEKRADSTRAPDASPPSFARITDVLPGGTLVLDNGEKAVLVGVVCPDRGQPMWKDCQRFIVEQTRGRLVRMVSDSWHSASRRYDSLGRERAYVEAEPDGRDVGEELIFQGYAWVDRDAVFDRITEYRRAEEQAWRSKRGIWAAEESAEGETRVATGRHCETYHSPKCEHVRHMTGVTEMTLAEAKSRRLVPCGEYRGTK